MRIPQPPPHEHKLLTKLFEEDGPRAMSLLTGGGLVDAKGRYLHWDEFRFKTPPDGLTHREWWVRTKFARTAAAQMLSVRDAAGRNFSFCEPPSLKLDLHKLDLNAGGALGLEKVSMSTADGTRYLARSLAEEPFASAFIEGAATTRQIAKKLIFEHRVPRSKDELMVLNNYNALEFVKHHKDDPLSIDLILELHRIVTEGTLDREDHSRNFRDNDDVQVVDDASGEVLHQPPPAAELRRRMRALVAFANEQVGEDRWMHPLLRAFAIHFLLSYEHPFVDGNGRVARALFYWYALKCNYWLIEYVSISSIIAESKISYGKSFLYVETDGSDLTYFLTYNAEILTRAMDRLHEYVGRKRAEVAGIERRISDRARPDAFNHRQATLISDLVKGCVSNITLIQYQEQHDVSYMTARNDLEALVTMRLMHKQRVGRQSIYVPIENISKKLSG
jgi:Fic family protein